MKLIRLIKIFLLAFLIVSMESRKLNSKTATAMKRYKRNFALNKASLFNISEEDVKDLALGIINGFLEVKKDEIIKFFKLGKEISILSYQTLNVMFTKCFPEANQNLK